MRYLIIHHNDDGDITQAYVEDVRNADTYAADGFLTLGDGRSRLYQDNVTLFSADSPLTHNVITWRADERYYVDMATGELYEYEGWTEPAVEVPPPAPEPEPEPEII